MACPRTLTPLTHPTMGRNARQQKCGRGVSEDDGARVMSQDKVLDAMENLANSWFERRHVKRWKPRSACARHRPRLIWFVSIKTGLVVRSSG